MKESTSRFPVILFVLALGVFGSAVAGLLGKVPRPEPREQKVRLPDISVPADKEILSRRFPLSVEWTPDHRGNFFFAVKLSEIDSRKGRYSSNPIITPYVKLPKPPDNGVRKHPKSIPISTLPDKPRSAHENKKKPEPPVTYHGIVRTRASEKIKVLFQNKADSTFFTLSPGETLNNVTLIEVSHRSVKIKTAEGREFDVSAK